jgi:hypothetical protein
MKARPSSFFRSSSFVFLLLVSVTATAVLAPREVRAQSAGNTGQIVGLVMDPTLASVAGAEVAVRNTNTNFSRTTLADAAGRFTLPLLPLGPYEITAKAPGFEPAIQETVVMLGSTVTANLTLSVGVNREAIEVSGEILPSDITVAASRAVLTDLQLRHLPLNGGRVQNIIWDIPTGQIEPE